MEEDLLDWKCVSVIDEFLRSVKIAMNVQKQALLNKVSGTFRGQEGQE